MWLLLNQLKDQAWRHCTKEGKFFLRLAAVSDPWKAEHVLLAAKQIPWGCISSSHCNPPSPALAPSLHICLKWSQNPTFLNYESDWKTLKSKQEIQLSNWKWLPKVQCLFIRYETNVIFIPSASTLAPDLSTGDFPFSNFPLSCSIQWIVHECSLLRGAFITNSKGFGSF